MCDWNSGSPPLATRSLEMASSGRTNPSSLSFGQWSVCSAMLTGYFLATSAAYAANATEPVTMSLIGGPGQVLGAAGGDLDDAVAAGVGEAAQRRVERLGRGDVDRRVREPPALAREIISA